MKKCYFKALKQEIKKKSIHTKPYNLNLSDRVLIAKFIVAFPNSEFYDHGHNKSDKGTFHDFIRQKTTNHGFRSVVQSLLRPDGKSCQRNTSGVESL